MTTPHEDLAIVDQRATSFGSTQDEAWAVRPCPECEGSQLAVIAYAQFSSQKWLRCINCGCAIVDNDGTVSPPAKPLRAPAGVTGVELAVWNEARSCLAVGANTAAVMMCRKLLFHIAVAHGLPPKNDKDRAPTFLEAVDTLEAEGLITKRMRPWVDRIKDVGNEANHEISAVQPEVALDVATFTEQLLRLTYEMDSLMAGGN